MGLTFLSADPAEFSPTATAQTGMSALPWEPEWLPNDRKSGLMKRIARERAAFSNAYSPSTR